MATEGQQFKHSFIAGADLSAKQYYFMKLSAADTVVVCAGTTDKPIGVLQNAPTAGQAAEVCYFGETKISGDADLAYGDNIGTSADGQAAAYTVSDTTKHLVGIVLIDNGAAGGLITALINCANSRTLA